ncbi:MAG TPA: hypothetical protein VGM39_15485 [Kofleriaceae bacterium]|jgi:hypothetical protein
MKFAVVAVLLGGCSYFVGEGPHIPDAYKGTMQITIVNAHDQPLCEFHLWSGEFANDNWLGTPARRKDVAPGATRTFSIKPGAYRVIGGFCDSDGQLSGVAGTEGELTATFDSPTTIALGAAPTAPSPHEKLLAFTNVRLDGAQPVNAGTDFGTEECQPPGAKVASSQDCCDTSKYHSIVGDNGQTAGNGAICE